ncbi:MAG: CocE/NonD family hydrolase [Armatimonadetes bacterium]|nr:CocE/NonD family hydrolase [Armatimonadota bacterium]
MKFNRAWIVGLVAAFAVVASAQVRTNSRVQTNYDKYEYMIPMRDGVKLHTAVYVPKDKPGDHPILLTRTPYSAWPYGEQHRMLPDSFRALAYIFAIQDVRGRYMSEGEFVMIRPNNLFYTSKYDVDESTDTYDTIEWLVNNVPDNNGRVGMRGTSQNGFYAAIGAVNSHPALKAVSPQGPVADWFMGDDVHRNGAFCIAPIFSWMMNEGQHRPEPSPNVTTFQADIEWQQPWLNDWYKFFLDLGPLTNIDELYYKGSVKFWADVQAHPDYDEWWQARSLPKRMTNVKCAVLTVGGWFDGEDAYGAQAIYEGIERLNPGIYNTVVIGPWMHGGWKAPRGRFLADMDWGSNTSAFFRNEIEFPFFDAFLQGDGKPDLPEAYMFDSGAKKWTKFDQWPPKSLQETSFYFRRGKSLSIDVAPTALQGFDQYVSDPKNPVPSDGGIQTVYTHMISDQRFVAARPDVLVLQTEPLEQDVTLAGPVFADLYVELSTTDADFVVKLIDVFPPDAGDTLANYQMLVRGEIMPARYRNSFQNPKPMPVGEVELVSYELPDVYHTFKKGHRIMVQVQSSWFPIVARNPQQFINIYEAQEEDYVSSTIRIHRSAQHPSRLRVGRLPNGGRTSVSARKERSDVTTNLRLPWQMAGLAGQRVPRTGP